MPRFVNRTGLRYGRLVALRHTKYDGRIRWLCRCDCGNETWVVSDALCGKTQSCGCLQRERASAANSTHGYSRPGRVSPTYLAWLGAKGRCENPNDSHFALYGGRGIKMCAAWANSFEEFLSHMGDRPGVGMSLDRIDVNGNYEPGNCRWATVQEQADNRRRTIWVEYQGRKLTLKGFAAARGVSYKALYNRVRYRGQDPHKAADAMR